MARPSGHWLCKLDGYPDLDTDRLRLREVVVAEEVTGLPYTLLDPQVSAKVAVALFGLMLMRNGVPEDQAVEQARDVELAQLHGAFSWVKHGTDVATEEVATSGPPPSAATSSAG